MILEALHFSAAYAVSQRRKRTEIVASVGLWSRARRCRKAWAPHEENCQAFIEEKVGQMSEHGAVAVLGSGLLNDIPLDFLSRAFKEIRLYDRVHLPSARLKARATGRDNIRFVECDLAGGLDRLSGDERPDLVISALLLSQMALAAPRPAEVVRRHVDDLLGGPWVPCLITDTGFAVRDRTGRIVKEGDLLGGEAPPPAFRAWDWTVAPFGEVARDTETVHRVIAV